MNAKHQESRIESRLCTCGHYAREHALALFVAPGEQHRRCHHEACECAAFTMSREDV